MNNKRKKFFWELHRFMKSVMIPKRDTSNEGYYVINWYTNIYKSTRQVEKREG